MAQLYVVATPIGNLEDITYRAVRVLKEVDTIACEDTRHTRKLLDHWRITTRLVSYHEHNEAARAAELIADIRAGRSVALVSDAGTPLISDPGYRIVHAAAEAGIPVVPIPGASAAIAALSASGLPNDEFRFCGFLPAKESQRRRVLSALEGDRATLIFYEAPHRIVDTLKDILAAFGARPSVLAREVTKLHEEFLRGPLDAVLAELEKRPAVKGEFTILIGRGDPGALVQNEPICEAVDRLEREGLPRMEAMKRVARERGISKRDVYREIEQRK